MITRITRSLEAKRAKLANDEKGFTLIELLVVVLIIGVLAAIAIPIFLGQQESAKINAMESDLNSAKAAIVAEMVKNTSFGPLTAGALPALSAFSGSNDVTITVAASPAPTSTSFCLDASHTGITGTLTADQQRHVSDVGGVKHGTCASPVTPTP